MSTVRIECPNVRYSQVLKYELNDIYHFIKVKSISHDEEPGTDTCHNPINFRGRSSTRATAVRQN